MTAAHPHRIFVWLDRAFWLIWLGFPVLIWLLVSEIRSAPEQLAEINPEAADCIAKLPQIAGFSATGQFAFWAAFGIEFVVYAVLLALAHGVIHRCATGRVFVDEMIGALRLIGLIIASWPLADLVLQNVTGAVLAWTGDLPAFSATVALDLPVLGVGLLMVTMSVAMAQAVRLREDADLTI